MSACERSTSTINESEKSASVAVTLLMSHRDRSALLNRVALIELALNDASRTTVDCMLAWSKSASIACTPPKSARSRFDHERLVSFSTDWLSFASWRSRPHSHSPERSEFFMLSPFLTATESSSDERNDTRAVTCSAVSFLRRLLDGRLLRADWSFLSSS